MGYFVTRQEIESKGKDVGLLLALTLVVGVVGCHRFYLRRYLSGLIILLAVFSTSGVALIFVIPLVMIEFIVFASVSNKMTKNIKSSTNVAETQTDTSDVTIYDISEIETSRIESQDRAVQSVPVANTWIRKLELPYERRDLCTVILSRNY